MSKVTDKYGNELRDGDTIAWQLPGTPGFLCTVKDVVSGGLAMPNGKDTGGKLTLEIELPFKMEGGKDIGFGDMVKTFHPASTKLADIALMPLPGGKTNGKSLQS
jgi:hypothetical protein